MTFKVYPYKLGSASAKALSVALEGKVLKHVGSKYKPKAGDTVINWGAGKLPNFAPARVLNKDVSDAQCKLATFKTLSVAGVNIPPYAENAQDAHALGYPVVCRTKLRGHSGDGIVIAKEQGELVRAPLYTKYIKKKDEYRVHVLGGEAFFIQRKARKLENDNPNWLIRNLAGGFVFVEVQANEVPADILRQAINTIAALRLDFGGVDVMWNEREGKAYVLEVNTACGLEERTAEHYAKILRAI